MFRLRLRHRCSSVLESPVKFDDTPRACLEILLGCKNQMERKAGPCHIFYRGIFSKQTAKINPLYVGRSRVVFDNVEILPIILKRTSPEKYTAVVDLRCVHKRDFTKLETRNRAQRMHGRDTSTSQKTLWWDRYSSEVLCLSLIHI